MRLISLVADHLDHEGDHLKVVEAVPVLHALNHLLDKLLVDLANELVVRVLQRVVKVVAKDLQQVSVSLLKGSHLSDGFSVLDLARVLSSRGLRLLSLSFAEVDNVERLLIDV